MLNYLYLFSVQGLEKLGATKAIAESVKKCEYSAADIGCPEIRHFLYKSKTTAQFTSSEMGQPYVDDDEAQRRVQSLYLYAQSKTHSSGRNVKFLYYTGSYETIAAWVSGIYVKDV